MDISEYLPMFLAEAASTSRSSTSPSSASRRARRPRDGRRDLPHRPLPQGHERDDGLRRHGGAHPRDGGRLRAAAPAHGRPRRARRSTCCSSASTRSRPRSTRSRPTARRRSSPAALIERLQGPRPRPHARPAGAATAARPRRVPPAAVAAVGAGQRVLHVPRHARRRRADAVGARLHGARRARRARRGPRAPRPTEDDVDGFDGRAIEAWLADRARGRARSAPRAAVARRRRRDGRRGRRAPAASRGRAGRRARAAPAAAAERGRAARKAARAPSASTPSASTS